MNSRAKQKGFTIVELLIVIVVIGILAAITIVAYNGIQDRSKFTRARSDFNAMQKGLEMYKANYGGYPLTPSDGWIWSHNSPTGYIPGIVSEFANTLPTIADGSGMYLYRSIGGAEYKIIKHKSGGIVAGEWDQVPASMKDQYIANKDRYGVWSPGGSAL